MFTTTTVTRSLAMKIFPFYSPICQRRRASFRRRNFSFLASLDKSDVIKKYSYQSNSGICFEISPHSHHFVSPVEGERNSLIMYLWKTDSKYDGVGSGNFEISEIPLRPYSAFVQKLHPLLPSFGQCRISSYFSWG